MSVDVVELTGEEIEAALGAPCLKIPDRTGIVRGARYSMSVKIGGKMEMGMVICKGEPRQRTLRDGRKVWVVDVFGYGVSEEVWVSKLREIGEPMEANRG
jgi:hypothetical protein